MARLRRVLRLGRLLAVVGLGLGMAGSFAVAERLGLQPSEQRRQRWTQAFMRRLSAALPFEVRISGQVPQRPMLWLSNHVSWTDIPLLGMLTPLSFLSKAEVRHWPVAGWLAAKAGTLFLRRGAGDAQGLRTQIGERLTGARPLLIFPEGTTSDGLALRTFHGRLLAGAIDTATPVQPVAIAYRREEEVDSVAPFLGDDDLLSHLLRLFALPRGQVHIQLLAPIPSAGMERAVLAFQTQQAVQQALFPSEVQPCSPQRTARAA